MSLNSCEHDYCIVVHEGIKCSLCEAEERIKDLKNEIEDLENRNERS